MRKKHFLFAALFLAALVFGFSACENPNGDLLNNGDDNTGITDNDSTTNNPDQGGDNNGGNKPTTPEVPTLVATGAATDVEYSSVTLWGRLNTDSLPMVGNVTGWGIEYAYNRESVELHKHSETTKVKCNTELQGENADEFSVKCSDLTGGVTIYYSAYALVDMKYVYGEVDSVHLDVRLTVNSNNSSYGTVSGSGDYAFGDEATLTATPNSGVYFVEWNDGNTDNPRTVIVNEDITYTATFAGNPNGTANGHEYVDLGLPSGTKWATCNVGATTPEEAGNCYAWGETEPKTTYDWSTYKWCNGSYDTLTKYNTDAKYGTVDNKTVLDPEDDAARANWGGAWRMPTDEEWTELRKNCEWTWTSDYNGTGVAGRIVTSNINGNSIFLPAAGGRFDDVLDVAGIYGYYWSSSLYTDSRDAWSVYFDSDYVGRGGSSRYIGRSVRPVL